MQPTSAVSRPAWVNAMNALTGTGGTARKSPVEIVADAASVVTRSHYAEFTGVRAGKLGRWTDGVAAMRADRATFASYWAAHNDRVRQERANDEDAASDPLWVVLGDSTAQGLGAPGPKGGYVGQALAQLRRNTGQHWRVINLSVSGALTRDVLARADPAAGRRAAGPRHLRRRRQRHPVQRPGQALRRPAGAAEGGPRQHRPARPAAADRVLGDRRPHQRPLHHPHQPRHPRGRRSSATCRSRR